MMAKHTFNPSIIKAGGKHTSVNSRPAKATLWDTILKKKKSIKDVAKDMAWFGEGHGFEMN